MYRRDFGGRRYNGRWATGLRYFAYEGNTAAGAWLNIDLIGGGFTSATLLRVISFSQEASGAGPRVSLEFRQHFFRDRLTLYQQGRAAFVLQSLETDSGEFLTLVRDPVQQVFIPANARLRTDTNKSSWQPGLELGLRVRLLEGFHLYGAYVLDSFQDVVLYPVEITIPENPGQIPQGVTAIYKTQDLQMSGWLAGLTFQF